MPFGVKILPNGSLAVCGWHYGSGNIGGHLIETGNVSNQNAFIACYNPYSEISDEVLPPASVLKVYPNPFCETLKIVSSKSNEQVDIYNLKGQKIRQLKSLSNMGSKYESTWDGCDNLGRQTSPGIYLIKGRNGSIKALKL